MATPQRDLKNLVIEALDDLPADVLTEVAAFLEFQRFKLARRESTTPPYRPVALGGLWKGIRITDEDIREARRDMWKRFADDDA